MRLPRSLTFFFFTVVGHVLCASVWRRWRENKIRGSECLDVKEESLRGEERGKRRGRESEQEGEKEERNIRERREAPRKAAGEHESFFGEHEDKKRGWIRALRGEISKARERKKERKKEREREPQA